MDLRCRAVSRMISIDLSGLREVTRDVGTDISEASTGAMRQSTYKAVRELRRQVTDAGMSQRLANTWRDRVYPERRISMVPTGYIWSNAPDIINAFTRGATIRPVNGSKYLWIPTKNVPRSRRRMLRGGRAAKGGAMTPDEVESAFNADFVMRPGANGTVLAFMPSVARRNGRGYRPATKGRVRQSREVKMILMFVLRTSVKLDRVFDLDAVADRWANNFAAAFGRAMEG